ncbi:hypothetical protein [Stenotrophomonas sepilia]
MILSRITLGILASLAAAPAFAKFPNCPMQYWSPSSLQHKEQLPDTHRPGESGCKVTELGLSDYQWMEAVRLPTKFALLRIANRSTSPDHVLKINGRISGIAGEPLNLPGGRTLEFMMSSNDGAFFEDDYEYRLKVPNQWNWQIPANKHLVSIIDMRNGSHVHGLTLPASGNAFDTIAINNHATNATQINGTYTQFPKQKLTVMPGQSARAEYDAKTRKWNWVHSEYYLLRPDQWDKRVSSRSIIELYDGEWTSTLALPLGASDRDRRIIRSDASWESSIRLNYFDREPVLPLYKGDEYEFIYLAELRRWQVLRQVAREVKFHELGNGSLEETASLVRVVVGSPYTRYRTLALPTPERGQNGRRVIVDNTALWQIDVAQGALRETVRPREQVAFRVNDKGDWERETTTIDLLFIVDQQVEAVGGMSGALELMEENLKLTNEALENSGATFRYRQAHVLANDFTFPGVESFDIAHSLGHDPDVTAIRKLIKADGIYYGGTRNTNKRLPCGIAYTSLTQGIYSIATSLQCPTTTLRQQVAYGLGMPKAQPRQPVPVIGYGNELPYYPTPHKVLPNGYRAFNPGQEGYVDRMNERAELVAGFSDLL